MNPFRTSIAELRDACSEASWSPRSGSRSPSQVERVTEPWTDAETLGLWECTEGTFPSSRVGRTEICLILRGRAEVASDSDASVISVSEGDVLVLPDGWSGSWNVIEPIEKVYINVPRSTED